MTTAYTVACPVPSARAMTTASTAATSPASAARARPIRNDRSSRRSRTGTCAPATNMTRANPISARKANRSSVGSR